MARHLVARCIVLLLLRWLVVFAMLAPSLPFSHTYDFLSSVEDVAVISTVASLFLLASAIASRPPQVYFQRRWISALVLISAALCGMKFIGRLLELPPESDHVLGRWWFCILVIILSCISALECSQIRSHGERAAAESIREVQLLSNGETRADERESQGGARKQVRRLLGLAHEHRVWVFFGCIALLVRLPFSIAIPHFASEGIGGCIDHQSGDAARQAGAEGRVRMAVIFLLLSGTMDALLDFANWHLFVIVQQKVIQSLKLRLFENVLQQELGFFDESATGDLMSRLTADTVEMSSDISFVFRFSIEAVVRIVGIAGYMFFCSWRLACLTCTVIPMNSFLNHFYADWIHTNAKRSQDALADSNMVAQEALSSVQTIKAFAKEHFELARYTKAVKRYYELGLLQGVVQGTYYMFVSTFLMNCVMQSVLVSYGAMLIWRGVMPVESLVAFMLYRSDLQNWVNQLLNAYSQILRGAGASLRVFHLLERKPRLHAGVSGPPELARGLVQFIDVHFAYATRLEANVLQGISFEAMPGQCVALVGGSGAGKSTVFHLLMHFYEPTAGRVMLDDMNVERYEPRVLCKRISMVSQEPTLFRGSVEDNIRYPLQEGVPGSGLHGWEKWWSVWRNAEENAGLALHRPREPTDVAIEEAARVANAHDFIMSLPEGYATEVGDRGVQLSGGQKQRVAIARATLQKPCVLLLDEATSALDTASERLVQEALERAMQHQTTLVIAHRLSTIKGADVLLVMEKGCIVERGTHEQLLQLKGRYAELWRRQLDVQS